MGEISTQFSLSIHVYDGEDKDVQKNVELGVRLNEKQLHAECPLIGTRVKRSVERIRQEILTTSMEVFFAGTSHVKLRREPVR